MSSKKSVLNVKENGQEYATVMAMLGDGRLTAKCMDGVERICHIRGALKKKVWISKGDTILIGLRDFQDKKGDVILKYSDQEVRMLRSMGEINDAEIKQDITETEYEPSIPFDFAAI